MHHYFLSKLCCDGAIMVFIFIILHFPFFWLCFIVFFAIVEKRGVKEKWRYLECLYCKYIQFPSYLFHNTWYYPFVIDWQNCKLVMIKNQAIYLLLHCYNLFFPFVCHLLYCFTIIVICLCFCFCLRYHHHHNHYRYKKRKACVC